MLRQISRTGLCRRSRRDRRDERLEAATIGVTREKPVGAG
jgi:hypothetical protein